MCVRSATGDKDLLSTVTEPPAAKLRVKEASGNAGAESLGIRVHLNTEVPAESLAGKAFESTSTTVRSGREDLGPWRTSGGPVGDGPMSVEAVTRGRHPLVPAALHTVDCGQGGSSSEYFRTGQEHQGPTSQATLGNRASDACFMQEGQTNGIKSSVASRHRRHSAFPCPYASLSRPVAYLCNKLEINV